MAKYQKISGIKRLKKEDLEGDLKGDLKGHWIATLECGHIAILRANRPDTRQYVNCYECDRRVREEAKKVS